MIIFDELATHPQNLAHVYLGDVVAHLVDLLEAVTLFVVSNQFLISTKGRVVICNRPKRLVKVDGSKEVDDYRRIHVDLSYALHTRLQQLERLEVGLIGTFQCFVELFFAEEFNGGSPTLRCTAAILDAVAQVRAHLL